jgi:hypothetical protein
MVTAVATPNRVKPTVKDEEDWKFPTKNRQERKPAATVAAIISGFENLIRCRVFPET